LCMRFLFSKWATKRKGAERQNRGDFYDINIRLHHVEAGEGGGGRWLKYFRLEKKISILFSLFKNNSTQHTHKEKENRDL
jgi:hypothetical protein